jgi:hypothetical protein
MRPTDEPVITMRGVVKTFGATRALDDLELTVVPEHLARARAEQVTALPILVVLRAAAALLVAGVEGYARRDIG